LFVSVGRGRQKVGINIGQRDHVLAGTTADICGSPIACTDGRDV
jgi:hypothetical protein